MAFEELVYMTGLNPGFITALFIWSIVWKGIALWYSARNRHKAWFVLILILNTAGILPIAYLVLTKFPRSPFYVKRAAKKGSGKRPKRKK